MHLPSLLPRVPPPGHAPRCALSAVRALQWVRSGRKRFIGHGEPWPARGCRAQCTLGLIVEALVQAILGKQQRTTSPGVPCVGEGVCSTTPSLRFLPILRLRPDSRRCKGGGGVRVNSQAPFAERRVPCPPGKPPLNVCGSLGRPVEGTRRPASSAAAFPNQHSRPLDATAVFSFVSSWGVGGGGEARQNFSV